MSKQCSQLVGVLVIAVMCLILSTAQASTHDGTVSLLNPWNPATAAVETAVDRTLEMGARMPHAGFDNFSSWNVFSDYQFGKSKDKRANGWDNYSNSYTLGADAFYNTTLWGFMGNFNDAQGRNDGGARNELDTWSYTLYMSRAINQNVYWGMSFSYSDAEQKIKNTPGDTDTESYVIAPYLTFMKQLDKMNLSLSPSYVLGYQEVDYPAGGGDDTALMGKLVLMGRAAYAINEKASVSGNLDFNQVLHNHGLDSETDNDHNWFTTGVDLSYRFTDQLNGKVGYSTEFDSDFDSDLWNFSLSYAF